MYACQRPSRAFRMTLSFLRTSGKPPSVPIGSIYPPSGCDFAPMYTACSHSLLGSRKSTNMAMTIIGVKDDSMARQRMANQPYSRNMVFGANAIIWYRRPACLKPRDQVSYCRLSMTVDPIAAGGHKASV